MSNVSPETIANLLLAEQGQTFAQELNIPLDRNNPSALFRLLCASLLFAARIQESIAINAARALVDQGWNTPGKMLNASWEDRAKCLNQAGYSRFDERTATMLGDTARLLCDRYDGDLRQLRDAANRDPQQERDRLMEFKGIGQVGANIFLREVQGLWEEVFPFADDRILETARAVHLPDSADGLRQLVSKADFPRLVAALVRVRLAHTEDQILQKAG